MVTHHKNPGLYCFLVGYITDRGHIFIIQKRYGHDFRYYTAIVGANNSNIDIF